MNSEFLKFKTKANNLKEFYLCFTGGFALSRVIEIQEDKIIIQCRLFNKYLVIYSQNVIDYDDNILRINHLNYGANCGNY